MPLPIGLPEHGGWVPTFHHENTLTASQVTPATAIPIKQHVSDFPLKRGPDSNRHVGFAGLCLSFRPSRQDWGDRWNSHPHSPGHSRCALTWNDDHRAPERIRTCSLHLRSVSCFRCATEAFAMPDGPSTTNNARAQLVEPLQDGRVCVKKFGYYIVLQHISMD